MRKRDGAIKELVLFFITTFGVIVIIMKFLEIAAVIEKNADIQHLARGYLLEMETEGCMTASMCTRLTQQLSDMGATDIDMSGTTLSEAGYGNWIYLKVTCVIPFEQMNLDAGYMNVFLEEKEWAFYVDKATIAKH